MMRFPYYRISMVQEGTIPFNLPAISGKKAAVCNAQSAARIFRSIIATKGQPDREQMCVLMLNAKNKIVGCNIVAMGTTTNCQVSPRELLKPAILANATAIVIGHNHPSGDCTPSAEDRLLTFKIHQAADLLGMVLHDHIIVSMENDEMRSAADDGWLTLG